MLLYLFRRIEQRLDGRPTLIEIDEAWMALLHPRFGPRVTQWLLTLRKQNAAVVLATQSPAQLAQLATRHAVIDSCPTKFYLPNPDAASPGAAALYHDLGLNDREVETIATATPKRHYYVKSPRGSRLFDLALGPVALAFLSAPAGQTVEESKRQIEGLIAQHEATWPAEWLAQRGLPAWSETLHKVDHGVPLHRTSLAGVYRAGGRPIQQLAVPNVTSTSKITLRTPRLVGNCDNELGSRDRASSSAGTDRCL